MMRFIKVFQPRQTVIARANSLKKAIESILDTTEKGKGTCGCKRD